MADVDSVSVKALCLRGKVDFISVSSIDRSRHRELCHESESGLHGRRDRRGGVTRRDSYRDLLAGNQERERSCGRGRTRETEFSGRDYSGGVRRLRNHRDFGRLVIIENLLQLTLDHRSVAEESLRLRVASDLHRDVRNGGAGGDLHPEHEKLIRLNRRTLLRLRRIEFDVCERDATRNWDLIE